METLILYFLSFLKRTLIFTFFCKIRVFFDCFLFEFLYFFLFSFYADLRQFYIRFQDVILSHVVQICEI